MEPYATVEDLKAAWPSYDAGKEARARYLLSFASSAIAAMCDASRIDAAILKGVACQAVIRMMQSDGEASGVTQESWGASPYSGSVTYSNPSGDLYLTAFEKRLLGMDGDMDARFAMPGGMS